MYDVLKNWDLLRLFFVESLIISMMIDKFHNGDLITCRADLRLSMGRVE